MRETQRVQKTNESQRVRGSNLAVFVKSKNGVPMEEALRKADDAGLVIASNRRLSKALIGSKEHQSIDDAFVCWSGPMTAYDKPDEKLGKEIIYTDSKTGTRYIFPVPEEYQGKENVVLVAEHPKFSLVTEGNDWIVQAAEVDAVERFPASNGWYLGDPRYDIPQGNGVYEGNDDARHLWRMERRVGLVVRGSYYWSINRLWSCVFLDLRPSNALGVVVESPEATSQDMRIREGSGKLVIEGTQEQLAAAKRKLAEL